MSKPPVKGKTIDRNNFNILNKKKSPNLTTQIPNEQNEIKNNSSYSQSTTKENKINSNLNNPKETEKEKDKEKKFFKFQNMSKLIVNKIDDILGSYSNPGYASSSIGNYSDTVSLSKNILSNIETNLQIAEENELLNKLSKNKSNKLIETAYSSNSSRNKINSAKILKNSHPNKENEKKKYNLEEIEKNSKEVKNIIVEMKDYQEKERILKSQNSTKFKKVKKLKKSSKENNNNQDKKDVFMTKVDVEGNISSSHSEEEIKRSFNEDELFDSSDDDFKVNPELKKEMNDFKNLMGEINDLKKNMQTEFDELQYLIKYVDGTSNRVNRHINGVSNLFKESGLKPKSENKLYNLKEASDESDDDRNDKGLYNKGKNMDKIKDNLINLQDNFIGFYKNFDGKMKNIENKNTKYKQMLLYEKKGDEKLNL